MHQNIQYIINKKQTNDSASSYLANIFSKTMLLNLFLQTTKRKVVRLQTHTKNPTHTVNSFYLILLNSDTHIRTPVQM